MQSPRPYIYEDWLELQSVIARDERGEQLVYCQNPPVLDGTQQPIKLRKPWGEIIVERGRFAVYTRRCDHWRRIYHGSWHFRGNARRVLQDEIKREWMHYKQELERYENLIGKAAQATPDDALRG